MFNLDKCCWFYFFDRGCLLKTVHKKYPNMKKKNVQLVTYYWDYTTISRVLTSFWGDGFKKKMWEKEKMQLASLFPTMFSILWKTNPIIWTLFPLSSANTFNMDRLKMLSSCNGLRLVSINLHTHYELALTRKQGQVVITFVTHCQTGKL